MVATTSDVGVWMHKVLIVANQTVGGHALASVISERVGDDSEFHLLVPVPSPVSSAVAVGAAAPDMAPTVCRDIEADRRDARRQLEFGLTWLHELGAPATGELAFDGDTAAAVARLVEQDAYDEVVVSTLPSTVSRWLRQDLPHRIERKVSVTVTVVSGAR